MLSPANGLAREMVGKIEAAVAARTNPDLVVIARTDARAVEGLSAAIDRAHAYRAVGADALFVEALGTVEEMERVAGEFPGVPLIANMVEGGKSPMMPLRQLAELGFAIVLLPISALLAATSAVREVLAEIRGDGIAVSRDALALGFADFLEVIGVREMDELSERFGRLEPR